MATMTRIKSQNKKGLALSSSKGFTLVELLVATAIFVVVSLTIVSIFLTVIRNQRRDFQVQNLQDNARYIIESFSKEVRMTIHINSYSASTLDIQNQDNKHVIYQFNSGNLQRNFESGGYQTINSDDITIQGSFSVDATGKRVTIVMTFSPKISATGAKPGDVRVQNTIAVRIY
jgi:prepilin-type N-terminal cleavage/methylation domain-containing protein